MAAGGQGDGTEEADGNPRRAREIATEVAEAVVRNYRGNDPETALSSLADFLVAKGQGESEFAAVVRELRAILRQRLPGPHRRPGKGSGGRRE